ncbi:lipocalin/cytosolic fatty-acid binding protein family protein [Aphelenchoides avenae]|nr:lipocalin/cytosolic fatty-acid binding protein family protein [Aphelenchus avenae]
MTEQFVGKWNLVESDNFEAYLKQVGVGLVTRKAAAATKPQLNISVNGNHWKIDTVSTFKSFSLEYDLNAEFEETTGDGRKLKSIFTFEDGKLIQEQKKIDPKDKDSRFERYVQDGKLYVVCDSEGVVAKRVYERAQ